MSDLFAQLQSLEHGTTTRETYLRAPFGYPGSKRISLPYILPHLPVRKAYVEVFGGGGAVLLNRDPSPVEVFNDRYSGVTLFYRVIRTPRLRVMLERRLELTPYSREEFVWSKNTWDKLQGDDDETIVERAARWYYMVQMSFVNKRQAYARSTHAKSHIWNHAKGNISMFPEVARRFEKVNIENLDWRNILQDFDSKDTVFYLDPPYVEVNSGIYEHEMSRSDHAEMCERIFQLQGFVALSGYPNGMYEKYPWDDRIQWSVSERMTALAFTETNNKVGREDSTHRGTAVEVLWIKEAKNG